MAQIGERLIMPFGLANRRTVEPVASLSLWARFGEYAGEALIPNRLRRLSSALQGLPVPSSAQAMLRLSPTAAPLRGLNSLMLWQLAALHQATDGWIAKQAGV